MNVKADTVDEYINSLPEHAATKIASVCEIVKETAPQLAAGIKWNSPAFIHPDGAIMLIASAHKTHLNIVFSTSTREHFAADLVGIEGSKGVLKFGYSDELPLDVLKKMVAYRVTEYEDHGVNWK